MSSDCHTPAMFKRVAAFVLLSWGLQGLSWGQARREVIVDLPADVVWYDDVETAVQAQRTARWSWRWTSAVKGSRPAHRLMMLLKDLTYLLATETDSTTFPIGLRT